MASSSISPSSSSQSFHSDTGLPQAYPLSRDCAQQPPSADVPMTAEAYLASVRRQSASLPRTLASSLPLPDLSTPPSTHNSLAPPPTFSTPSASWARNLLASFSSLQATLQSLPSPMVDSTPRASDASSWSRIISPPSPPPTLSFIASLDHSRTAAALRAVEALARNRGPSSLLTAHTPAWTFALLAVLHPPIPPDAAATLHALLRGLCEERARLVETDAERVASVNVLIVILAFHFGQDTGQSLEEHFEVEAGG